MLPSVQMLPHAPERPAAQPVRPSRLGHLMGRTPLALRLRGVLFVLVLAVIGVASSSSFFAFRTSGVSRLIREEILATSHTGNTIHFVLIEAGNHVGAAREAASRGKAGDTAAELGVMLDWAQACFDGRPECPRLPADFTERFHAVTNGQLALAAAAVAAAARGDDAGYEQLRGEFMLSADRLHAQVSEWQARRIEATAAHMGAMSEAAERTSGWILLAAAAAVVVGLLGFTVARDALGRLRLITAAMLRLATGVRDARIPAISDFDEIGDMARALGVFRDTASRLAKREAELRTANVSLDAALNSMVQGLCLFDAENRLIVANARFRVMFGLPVEAVEPGSTYLDIIATAGARAGLDAAWVAESARLIGRQVAAGLKVTDRRTVFEDRTLSASFTPIEGGGWMVIYEDITDRCLAEARIAHMAHHDALTGLPNRILFQQEIQAASAGAGPGTPIAVLYLDLDRFKQVNDTLGHPAGDELLRQVAARLRANLRERDTLARLGGDEFAIVQVNIRQAADTRLLAQRCVEVLSEPFDLAGNKAIIGTSIGIALSVSSQALPETLMQQADLALYAAKAAGRGSWRVFEPGMDEKVRLRRAMEMDLRQALANEEFEIHYQPLVDLATSRCVDFEALVRWRHPVHGMVAPGDFIPMAEDLRLILPLGEWVLRQACRQAAGWPGQIGVSVNLSAIQFSGGGLVPAVVAALAESGLAPGRLWLEITETAMIRDMEGTRETLRQIKALGVSIAMDDFGTGYSSLSYLQSFPFDKIKIDRSFTQGLPAKEECCAIVRAIAGLGISLGMTVIAEGIETPEQCEMAAQLGCTQGQGYLFSEPHRPEQVLPFLAGRFGNGLGPPRRSPRAAALAPMG